MRYIIFDLEATCWKGEKGKRNEIIEIGAVMLDQDGKQISQFSEFVKPMLNPILSPFCKELTTITQEEVDSADTFPEVCQRFIDWFDSERDGNYILCSWGNYDRSQCEKDCELHNLADDWVAKHTSIKHQYTKIAGLKRHVGMMKALRNEGLRADGTHHRGIDDARNIAKIFVSRLGEWKLD